MESNLSEYITEYYTTDYEENDNYDEIWAEKEDEAWEDIRDNNFEEEN